MPGKGSLDQLAHEFMANALLNANSSVHTVLNTCEKIVPKMKTELNCGVCGDKMDKLHSILEI
jgi:hypothetical protein